MVLQSGLQRSYIPKILLQKLQNDCFMNRLKNWRVLERIITIKTNNIESKIKAVRFSYAELGKTHYALWCTAIYFTAEV